MRFFSIKDLERFSDIKAHTIRAWENRYSVFTPGRKISNVRYYELDDIMRLLHISLLVNNGYKISKLAPLTNEELSDKVTLLRSAVAKKVAATNQLILSMFASDTDKFEAVLDDSLFSFGIDVTIRQVLIPFMEKVQMLSYKDTSNETHLAVTAVRKKLILALESAGKPMVSNKTALLYLPKGEHYDLVLLYMAYLMSSMGIKVLYLGTNISSDNLMQIVQKKQPDMIYTYLSPQHAKGLGEYTKVLEDYLKDRKLYIAMPDSRPLQEDCNICYYYFGETVRTLHPEAV